MHVRRSTAVATTVAALLVLTAWPAWAHAGFDIRQLGAGTTERFELRVPIETESPNSTIDVLVPIGWTVDVCPGAVGWSCEITPRDNGDTVLNMAAEDDAAGEVEFFTIEMTAPDEQGTYSFPVVQIDADGAEAAWIGEAGSERPAPTIQVGDDDTPVERDSELPSTHDELTPAVPSESEPPSENASDPASGEPTVAASSSEPASPSEAETSAEPAASDSEPDTVTAADEDEGLSPIVWAVIVLVVVGIVGAAIAARRR